MGPEIYDDIDQAPHGLDQNIAGEPGELIDPGARERSLRYGLLEGAFSALYSALCGGVFVVGLAVALGADELTVGILGASPFLALIATFFGTWLLEKGLSRRVASRSTMFIARLMWLPFVGFYFMLNRGHHAKLVVLALTLVTLISALIGAMGQITWLGWMTEVVPVSRRGHYFGVRNAIVGLVSTVVIILGGWLIDWNFGLSGRHMSLSYFVLYAFGGITGLIGVHVLGKIAGGGREKQPRHRPSFGELLALPMKNPNFKRFIVFQFVWMFGVYISAPFCAVIMLRELHAGMKFVTLVTAIFSLANVITYRGWGLIADRYGNKPVLMLCTLVGGAFPLWWFFVNPHNYVAPLIAYYITAGIFWAGFLLAVNNLLLRLAPETHNSAYLSLFNTVAGVASTAGPLLGGALGMLFTKWGLGHWMYPILGVFFLSAALRYASVPLLAKVKEPEEATVFEVLKVLGSVRGVNTLLGFDALIEFILMPIRKNGKNGIAVPQTEETKP